MQTLIEIAITITLLTLIGYGIYWMLEIPKTNYFK
jgi:hypothetical protein